MKELIKELNFLVDNIKVIQNEKAKQDKTNKEINRKIKELMNQQNLFLKKLDNISKIL